MEQKYNMQNNKKNMRNNTNQNLSLGMVTSLLAELRELLLLDFSEENWHTASEVVRALSTCTSPEVYSRVGSLWSNAFVQPGIDFIDSEIKSIVSQVETENMEFAKI